MRQERVVVETDRYRVEGRLTLPREGYRSRLSDYVNRRDHDFFTIVDAELRAIDGSGRDWQAPVLMLARSQIRLIVPLEEGS
jgi:hypothetical protein